MKTIDIVLRSLGQGKVHPNLVLNTLIELDNQKGQAGLRRLEEELRASTRKLRPSAQPLAQAWLEALRLYRETYYPDDRLSKLFAQLISSPARTLPKAS
jgi:hypothetical protein